LTLGNKSCTFNARLSACRNTSGFPKVSGFACSSKARNDAKPQGVGCAGKARLAHKWYF